METPVAPFDVEELVLKNRIIEAVLVLYTNEYDDSRLFKFGIRTERLVKDYLIVRRKNESNQLARKVKHDK